MSPRNSKLQSPPKDPQKTFHPHACATCSEWPSNTITMILQEEFDRGLKNNQFNKTKLLMNEKDDSVTMNKLLIWSFIMAMLCYTTWSQTITLWGSLGRDCNMQIFVIVFSNISTELNYIIHKLIYCYWCLLLQLNLFFNSSYFWPVAM